jgi:hypothetical protein
MRGGAATRGLRREQVDDRSIKSAIGMFAQIENLGTGDPLRALMEAKRLAGKGRSALMKVKPATLARPRNKPHVGLTEQERQRIILAGR